MSKPILKFSGEYRWLSNFWPAKVRLYGDLYPTVENAYQAAKVARELHSIRAPFTTCSPHEAKSRGRRVQLRPDWLDVRVPIMWDLINQKFARGSELSSLLLSTGDAHIEEGNHWGDTFWGVCRGAGQNRLGKLIMEKRERLKHEVTEGSDT